MTKEPSPKKPTRKLRPDVAETAYRVMLEATGQAPKTVPPAERGKAERNPEAVKRGAKGGTKGGPARSAKMSPEKRSEIAKKAAQGRWDRQSE